MGRRPDAGAASHPREVRERTAAPGPEIGGLPPCHLGDGQSDARAARRRAEIRLCASNPLSTQDEVASSLVKDYGIPTYAIKGEDNDSYYKHILSVLENKPHFTMDDGADLVSIVHTKKKDRLEGMIAGTEETTTGVIRLQSMAKEGVLSYPIIAVNDAMTKHSFDNRYGTGQGMLDGIIRATNLLLAGLKMVVTGYGWCGRGVAQRASGLGRT